MSIAWKIGCIVFWSVLWPLLHAATVPLLLTASCIAWRRPWQLRGCQQRRRFLRRLLRSQVYYMLAATMGTILLLCGSFPWRCFVFLQRRPGVMREMVEGADDSQLSAMTCLAAAAMTHWLFAIVEDWLAWRYLAVHCQEQMSVQEHQIVQSASALCWIYTAHHFLAATVFGSFLLFEELAVLCCFGAFFELPVCFTNLRDLVVTFHKELEEVSSRFPLLSASFCRSWWNLTGFLVLLGRGSALLSFAYATALWNQELQQELPTVTSFAFRFYGASFTLLSILWSVQLLADRAADLYSLQRQSESLRSL